MNLLQPLLDYCEGKNTIRLLGPTDASRKAPTVALAVQGNAAQLAAKLAAHGSIAGGGAFYAVRCREAPGV